MEAGVSTHVWSVEEIAGVTGVTRSKELRRIEDAIAHKNEPELRWALAQCELRKKFARKNAPMSRLNRLEKRIEEALGEVDA